MSLPYETLRQLIANCRHKDRRILGFPRDWQPERVKRLDVQDSCISPYFTESAAWEFIVERLEEGHEYEIITLDKPKGARGLVMKIDVGPDCSLLYVKLQLGKANKVIGRSFHYSDYSFG